MRFLRLNLLQEITVQAEMTYEYIHKIMHINKLQNFNWFVFKSLMECQIRP